jgi:hypothetical protein
VTEVDQRIDFLILGGSQKIVKNVHNSIVSFIAVQVTGLTRQKNASNAGHTVIYIFDKVPIYHRVKEFKEFTTSQEVFLHQHKLVMAHVMTDYCLTGISNDLAMKDHYSESATFAKDVRQRNSE